MRSAWRPPSPRSCSGAGISDGLPRAPERISSCSTGPCEFERCWSTARSCTGVSCRRMWHSSAVTPGSSKAKTVAPGPPVLATARGGRARRREYESGNSSGGAYVKRSVALTFAVLMLVLVVGAAGQAQAPAPQRGGTIRVGITQEILNLDPHVATAFSSFQVMDLIYESLLRLNPRTLALEPNLATSWTVSADGLTYTFTLRRDAVFFDGTTVDASDVKATIDRILNPNTRSPQASFLAPVSEVTIVNPFVVRFTLKQPTASFLSLLTGPSRGIIPVNFEDKVGDPRVKALGSGPFALAEFGPGSVRLTRNDRYWRKDAAGNRLPYADGVVYRVIPDPATLRAAVRAGEVDLIIGFGVDITAARALQGDAGLRIISTPGLTYSLVG